jgi:hypothetical protein
MWRRRQLARLGLCPGDLEERSLGWPLRISRLCQQVLNDERSAEQIFRLLVLIQPASTLPLRRLTRALSYQRVRHHWRASLAPTLGSIGVEPGPALAEAERRAQAALFAAIRSHCLWPLARQQAISAGQAPLIEALITSWSQQSLWNWPQIAAVLEREDDHLHQLLIKADPEIDYRPLAEHLAQAAWQGRSGSVPLAEQAAQALIIEYSDRRRLIIACGMAAPAPVDRALRRPLNPRQLLHTR